MDPLVGRTNALLPDSVVVLAYPGQDARKGIIGQSKVESGIASSLRVLQWRLVLVVGG